VREGEQRTRLRLRRVTAAFGLVAVGLGGALAGRLTSESKMFTTTARVTTVEVVSGKKSAAPVPSPLPDLLRGANDAHDLTLASAVPGDANLVSADYVERKPEQLIVTWDREHLTHDGRAALWQRRGMAIWQHDRGSAATWHRVYTFEDAIGNAPVWSPASA